jgi:hypothetical protein
VCFAKSHALNTGSQRRGIAIAQQGRSAGIACGGLMHGFAMVTGMTDTKDSFWLGRMAVHVGMLTDMVLLGIEVRKKIGCSQNGL